MKALGSLLKPTVVLAAACLALSGCGGPKDNNPVGPQLQITPVPRANIVVTISSTAWGTSLAGGFAYAFAFDMQIRETNGVSATLQYLRADFYRGANGTGSRLERQQIPRRGLSQLPANGTLRDTFVARFNAGNASSVVITVGFNDANGNPMETTHTYNCCDPFAPGGLARLVPGS